VFVGKGINFRDGSDNERSLGTKVLIKHKEAVFMWAGQNGLFAHHVAEIPTAGEPIMSRAFRLNKHKREVPEEIIKQFPKRNIIKP
jgi:hypothetical protein